MAGHRSILEELNSLVAKRDKHRIIESRGEHIIKSAINLIEEIEQSYGPEVAKDLKSRLLNSIKGGDGTKFSRGIKKAIKEDKR